MAGTTSYFGISYPTNTDYVKDGATAMQTIATGFDTAVAIPTYNNQTGTTYTFVLADAAKVVSSNNASGVTFTIPPQSSVTWATGTTLTIVNYGAGDVTVAGGSGVTVTNAAATVAQYNGASLIRTGSDAWTLVPLGGGVSTTPIEYLVVGGGGSGGSVAHGSLSIGGGGGGAGGYLAGSVEIEKGINYSVIVGAGGTGHFYGQNSGNPSQFFAFTGVGGGCGGHLDGSIIVGQFGGSGGGGCYSATYGAGITGQGYRGGSSGNSSGNGSGGAGGGSSAVGPNGTTGIANGPAGGAGTSNSITGSAVTYAAGGNGGYSNTTNNGGSGSANTGNGGGGGSLYAGGNSGGGNGGSGIVVLKYPNTLTITASGGLTASTSTSGSYKITSITAGYGTVSWA